MNEYNISGCSVTCWWVLELKNISLWLHSFAFVNNVAMDICVHLFSYPFSVILGKHSKMKLLGYSVTLSFTFWGSDEVLAQLAAPLCFPSSNVGRFSFKIYLTILITFQVIFLYCFSYPCVYEMVPSSYDVYFSND